MHLHLTTHLRRGLALALLLALLLAAVPAAGPVYAAGPIMVDPTANDANDNNDGKCSLWEALQAIGQGSTYNQCNPGSTPYTIKFTGSGKLKVTNGALPYVTKNISIVGPVIIEGGGDNNMFVLNGDGILSLTNLTMTKGNPAILNLGPNAIINIAGCSFIDNKNDGNGGAIDSVGKINIAGSVFSGNSADGSDGGGAIHANGYAVLAIAGTVFNGNTARRSGGAIYTTAPANLVDVVFNGNIANGLDPNNNGTDDDPADDYNTQGGGAIFSRNDSANDRKMVLTRVVFNGNLTPKGHGGAIYINIGSTAEIQDSSFNGNLAGKPPSTERSGGAIATWGAKTSITRTTLLNNAVVGDGGGVASHEGGDVLTLSNVSMTGNAATGLGGGIYHIGGGIFPHLIVRNVTLALNAAQDEGGGIYADEPDGAHLDIAHLTNTIIDKSDGAGLGGNCAGNGVQSQGHNLDSGASCGFSQAGDLSNADPQLNTPAFNGGAISSLLSQKPAAGSAAIDAGDQEVCAAEPVDGHDVRGEPRPQGAICDIGAYEAAAPVAGFGSSPVPPGPISFGNVVFGAGQDAAIDVFGTGDKALQLSDPQISGSNAADFTLLTSFPLDVTGTTPVTLRCAPTGATPGIRVATFSFKTNDSQKENVSYSLICTAVAQPTAGFSSAPIAPGPLDFGDVIIGQTRNRSISIKESGTAPLAVNNPVLGGANPGDFSIGGGFDLNLPDGEPPFAATVSCTPTAPGIRSATLTMTTNDPAKPTVTFNLSCTGLTPPTPPLAPSGQNAIGAGGLFGVAVSPDGRHVYATAMDSNQLFLYRRNDNGNLTLSAAYTDGTNGVTNMIRPRFAALSPDGKNLYVASSTSNAVAAFSRDQDDGTLTFLDSVAEGGSYGCLPAPCETIDGLQDAYGVVVSPDGQHVYVTGPGDQSVVALRRSPLDGGLGNVLTGASYIETFHTPTATDLAGARGLAISPDGKNLYVAGYSSDTLVTIERNAADGTLTYLQTRQDGDAYSLVPLRFIDGLDAVFHVAVSPDGNDVYAVGQADNAIVAFRRNHGDKGKLLFNQVHKDGANGVDGLAGTLGLAVSPDGKYLFATGETDNAVAVFQRNTASGDLLLAQVVKRNGSGDPALGAARGIAIAPDSRHIYVASYSDNRVVHLPFANPAPTLGSLAPASTTATNDAIVLTVNGSDFVPGATVRWNNALDLTTTFVNSSQLKASVGVGLLANAGSRAVTVVNPAPGGGETSALTFTVTEPGQNPVPSIDELNPAGAAAGGPALVLTVKGANFIPGAKVYWNGVERPTTYVSGTTLRAHIPAGDVAQPGDAAVTVVNPTPGGGLSNAAGFGVAAPGENPVPAITALSPASIIAGANGSLTLTILGSNFLPGSQARWNGANRPTTFVGSSELQIEISGADLVTPGEGSVQVINPAPGGGPSNVAGFTIGAPGDNLVPALSAITGLALNGDGSMTVTLAGSGFVPSAQARWNGADRATVVSSDTQLTMTIAGTDFLGGSAVITVANPAPGGGTSNELLYILSRVSLPLLRR